MASELAPTCDSTGSWGCRIIQFYGCKKEILLLTVKVSDPGRASVHATTSDPNSSNFLQEGTGRLA